MARYSFEKIGHSFVMIGSSFLMVFIVFVMLFGVLHIAFIHKLAIYERIILEIDKN